MRFKMYRVWLFMKKHRPLYHRAVDLFFSVGCCWSGLDYRSMYISNGNGFISIRATFFDDEKVLQLQFCADRVVTFAGIPTKCNEKYILIVWIATSLFANNTACMGLLHLHRCLIWTNKSCFIFVYFLSFKLIHFTRNIERYLIQIYLIWDYLSIFQVSKIE